MLGSHRCRVPRQRSAQVDEMSSDGAATQEGPTGWRSPEESDPAVGAGQILSASVRESIRSNSKRLTTRAQNTLEKIPITKVTAKP